MLEESNVLFDSWKRLAIVFACTCIILVAPATSAIAGDGGVTGHITEVHVTNDGGSLRVRLDVPITNFPGCADSSFLMYYASPDSPSGAQPSRFFSAVLTAFATGKQVTFWMHSCTPASGDWGQTHPIMDDIYVSN